MRTNALLVPTPATTTPTASTQSGAKTKPAPPSIRTFQLARMGQAAPAPPDTALQTASNAASASLVDTCRAERRPRALRAGRAPQQQQQPTRLAACRMLTAFAPPDSTGRVQRALSALRARAQHPTVPLKPSASPPAAPQRTFLPSVLRSQQQWALVLRVSSLARPAGT
eukprot:3341771-Rhodomonas_salina.3